MPQDEHKKHAGGRKARVHVITVSDTRTAATDSSGAAVRDALGREGHLVAGHEILKDEPEAIARRVREVSKSGSADAVLLNGGTGISRRDSTFEAVDALFDRRIPGFGELFRFLSYREIGSAAMLSRAAAGLVGETLVFLVPGSTDAVRLAMRSLIIPELAHALWELKR
ncbi:MAG: MogA/MoaB family molybdenum cofactor biosynthesis protein [Deltaproteobacteria bacterium]|nr:MogA/MoaB family molybdenum cofactor biosynthesis protein [Deltaproteobacteria bacterium]